MTAFNAIAIVLASIPGSSSVSELSADVSLRFDADDPLFLPLRLDLAFPVRFEFDEVACFALYSSMRVVATYSQVSSEASFVQRAAAVDSREQFGSMEASNIGALRASGMADS